MNAPLHYRLVWRRRLDLRRRLVCLERRRFDFCLFFMMPDFVLPFFFKAWAIRSISYSVFSFLLINYFI